MLFRRAKHMVHTATMPANRARYISQAATMLSQQARHTTRSAALLHKQTTHMNRLVAVPVHQTRHMNAVIKVIEKQIKHMNGLPNTRFVWTRLRKPLLHSCTVWIPLSADKNRTSGTNPNPPNLDSRVLNTWIEGHGKIQGLLNHFYL